jgi:hypothetical protein
MSGAGSQGAAGRERAEEATSEYHNKDPYTFSKHHAVSYGRELVQLETSQPNGQLANSRLHFHEASSSQRTEPKVTGFQENLQIAAGQSLEGGKEGTHHPRQESLSLDEFAGSFEATQVAAQNQSSWARPAHARHPRSGEAQTFAFSQQVQQRHSPHVSQGQSSATQQLRGAGNLASSHLMAANHLGGAQTPMTEMHVLQHPDLLAPSNAMRFYGAAQELQSNLCISQLDQVEAMTEKTASQHPGPGDGAVQTARSGPAFEAFQNRWTNQAGAQAAGGASAR